MKRGAASGKSAGLLQLVPLLSWVGLVTGQAATLTVANISDSGPGSLRQALLEANLNPGLDHIVFAIPGAGLHTISPLAPLPPIAEAVVLDATTQPGYAGFPLIELNGSGAGNNAGLRILSGGCTVKGLCINRFAGSGIQIEGPGTNVLQANFLGTDAYGTVSRGNSLEGIWLNQSSDNFIGGPQPGEGNVISGNGDCGVYVLNGSRNLVCGNLIGTAANGLSAIGNANSGVTLYDSQEERVGGLGPEGNVISGNGGSGVYLRGAATTGTIISGNSIGTSKNGSVALSNSGDGITIEAAGGNIIGGAEPGAGNLIAGNRQSGISLRGAAGNHIAGNLVGTTAGGRSALGNGYAGVTLAGSSNNVIGDHNVISGNKQDGIYITTNSSANAVLGNLIGVDTWGSNAVPNAFNGITINSARENTIGGSVAGSGNVISANAYHGLQLLPGASGTTVVGNLLGTDITGRRAAPNGHSGIQIQSAGNVLGGVSEASRNVISGNQDYGVELAGNGANQNIVSGNYIGTSADGRVSVANGSAGVGLNAAGTNLIGGTAAGCGNVISGNLDAGLYIANGANANRVVGNLIGPDATGMNALGNGVEGIYVEATVGTVIGEGPAESGNTISANRTRGIFLTNAAWTVIRGNVIGNKHDRVAPLPNGFHNIELESGTANTRIVGRGAEGNIIANAPAPYCGVRVRIGSSNNVISASSIYGNGGLGIDLGAAGVTPNDSCDLDGGANLQQNFPVLTQATAGVETLVRGTLQSAAGHTYSLEFFASSGGDASGNGEGQVYLGQSTVATDGSCRGAFTVGLPFRVLSGSVVTATATDEAGNTSEFSPCTAVVVGPELGVTLSNGAVVVTWSNTPPGFILRETCSLVAPVKWSAVTNLVNTAGAQSRVAFPFVQGNRYYGLGIGQE